MHLVNIANVSENFNDSQGLQCPNGWMGEKNFRCRAGKKVVQLKKKVFLDLLEHSENQNTWEVFWLIRPSEV